MSKPRIGRPKLHRHTVYGRVDEETYNYLKDKAEKEDRSMSYITSKILEAGLLTIGWIKP